MKKRLLSVLAASILVLPLFLTGGPPVVAGGNNHVDLIKDVPGPSDMQGPVEGFVNFKFDKASDLTVHIFMKDGSANTTYIIFLVAGPTHATGQGYVNVGTLTTNPKGKSNSSISIPLATLQATPFGSGNRTDHFDIMKGVGDTSAGVYVASANYTVPVSANYTVSDLATQTDPLH